MCWGNFCRKRYILESCPPMEPSANKRKENGLQIMIESYSLFSCSFTLRCVLKL